MIIQTNIILFCIWPEISYFPLMPCRSIIENYWTVRLLFVLLFSNFFQLIRFFNKWRRPTWQMNTNIKMHLQASQKHGKHNSLISFLSFLGLSVKKSNLKRHKQMKEKKTKHKFSQWISRVCHSSGSVEMLILLLSIQSMW